MASEPNAGVGVYLASPMGFSELGRDYQARVVVPAIEKRGYRVLDPWRDDDGDIARRIAAAGAGDAAIAELVEINREVGARNVRLLDQADCVLALLDGPDVDSGTAAEIGYAAALGRLVVGWREDLRRAGENAATPVNLQLTYLIEVTGGRVARTLAEGLDAVDEKLGRSPASD